MRATRKQVQVELALAGLKKSDLDYRYLVDCIVSYRNTGRCGSVMFSTVEFIPVISKCLAALSSKT